MMQTYCARIQPRSAFGTPLLGDTLFGQLCWAIRNRLGNNQLEACLEGYTQGQPFLVVSDAFPAGFVPRPDLPSTWFQPVPDTLRKQMKKRTWMPIDKLQSPLREWQALSLDDKDAGLRMEQHLQPHNSIDRRSGTTNDAGFAPYGLNQYWYAPETQLDIYLLADEDRLDPDQLRTVLEDVGAVGFGRDASVGLGKFSLHDYQPFSFPSQQQANACLTLAPCAPQGLGYDAQRSFYQPFTRFGRHGDLAVHQSGQPFKNPVLLARAGAVFAGASAEQGWVGQGLGADGRLSKTIVGTVQQGYAPVISVHLPDKQEQAA